MRATRARERSGGGQLPVARSAAYHHGDLPAALLAAVDEIVREAGVGGVSLREAARRAGVTHSAPAHHFGDKAGLLTAFAAEGFRLLRDHLVGSGGAVTAHGERDCIAIGVAYVTFAVEHPAHFAVMFRPEHLHVDDDEYRKARLEAFNVLLDAFRALRDDVAPDSAHIVAAATGAWSIAHGFATLWLDGNLAELAPTPHVEEAAAGAFAAFGLTLIRATGTLPGDGRADARRLPGS